MADHTGIAWTQASWNALVGCQSASAGCDHCYAAHLAAGRLAHTPTYGGLAIRRPDGSPAEFTGEIRLLPERLDQPLRWRTPRMIFVNSMSDLFHPRVPHDFIVSTFAVMALTRRHTFQILTKRPQRMSAVLSSETFEAEVARAATDIIAGGQRGLDDDGWRVEETRHGNVWHPPVWPLPNVWMGVSVENQEWADRRIPHLLRTPAAVRWISAEPLLGPVTVARHFWSTPRVTWVVVGGESGPGARPMRLEWAVDLVAQCRAAGVPAFFKQTGTVLARELGLHGKGDADLELLPPELRERRWPA